METQLKDTGKWNKTQLSHRCIKGRMGVHHVGVPVTGAEMEDEGHEGYNHDTRDKHTGDPVGESLDWSLTKSRSSGQLRRVISLQHGVIN